jgi:hypothetical protein
MRPNRVGEQERRAELAVWAVEAEVDGVAALGVEGQQHRRRLRRALVVEVALHQDDAAFQQPLAQRVAAVD